MTRRTPGRMKARNDSMHRPMTTRCADSRSTTGPLADRGVSEMVAFVLSFSMIIVSVGILYTGGFGVLNDLQEVQQTENAEQVFLAVSSSFTELEQGQAPKRAGALDLDVGATITVVNQSTINISVQPAGFGNEYVTRSIEYTLGKRTVAYENGAVFREDPGGNVMLGEPPEFYCSNETNVAVVSITTIQAPNDISLAAGTVTLTGIRRSNTLEFPTNRTGPGTNVDNLTVNVSSPHEEAWQRYFEDESNDWVNPNGDDSYTCTGIDRAFVRHTVIEVRIVH